jgi:formamidopyrimidine-DNA glycosylase
MKTKYKIEIVEGCTAFATIINDVNTVDISTEEQEKIADYLIDQLKESYRNGEITLESLIQNFQYDDYEHDDHVCEQCGDTVSTTIYNI